MAKNYYLREYIIRNENNIRGLGIKPEDIVRIEWIDYDLEYILLWHREQLSSMNSNAICYMRYIVLNNQQCYMFSPTIIREFLHNEQYFINKINQEILQENLRLCQEIAGFNKPTIAENTKVKLRFLNV